MTGISVFEWSMLLAAGECNHMQQCIAAHAMLGDAEYTRRCYSDTLGEWIYARIPEWQRLGQERPCTVATANES